MKIRIYCLLITTMIGLSACGGGNSSSGADAAIIFENDGVYQGSQELTFSAPDGEVLDEDEFSFSMSVFEDNVTISDPSFSAQAPISSGVFIASSGEFNETQDEISCDITIIYNGTIGNGSAQGTVQGNYICTATSGPAEGLVFVFPLDGTFTATRTAGASKVRFLNDIRVDMNIIVNEIRNSQ